MTPVLRVEGDEVVLTGAASRRECVDRGDHVLVTPTGTRAPRCSCRRGASGVVDRADADASTYPPLLAVVTFDEVRVPPSAVVGELGERPNQVERQLLVALVLRTPRPSARCRPPST